MRPDSFTLLRDLARNSPTEPSIDELRREFADHGFEGWLWAWVSHVLLSAIALRFRYDYSAQKYSPTESWEDDGPWDLVQGFLLERGIKLGAVEAAITRADTASGAKRYLERSLRNYLISGRRRDTAGNVYLRLQEVLRLDPKLRPLSGFGSVSAYGLDEWSLDPPPRVDQMRIADFVQLVPDVHFAHYKTGDRRSPGLRSSDLGRIAHALVCGSGLLWTARSIMHAIELRFDLAHSESVLPADTVALEQAPSGAPSPLDASIASDLAHAFLSQLTSGQRTILRLMVEEPQLSVRDIAERLQCSKSAVNNEQHRIRSASATLPLAGAEEQLQVLDAAAEILRGS